MALMIILWSLIGISYIYSLHKKKSQAQMNINIQPFCPYEIVLIKKPKYKISKDPKNKTFWDDIFNSFYNENIKKIKYYLNKIRDDNLDLNKYYRRYFIRIISHIKNPKILKLLYLYNIDIYYFRNEYPGPIYYDYNLKLIRYLGHIDKYLFYKLRYSNLDYLFFLLWENYGNNIIKQIKFLLSIGIKINKKHYFSPYDLDDDEEQNDYHKIYLNHILITNKNKYIMGYI
jgi:hypothetical protein